MKLNGLFDTVELQDEIIAVPIGERADRLRGVIKLNQSGKEIFDMLKEEITEDQIVSSLAAKYEDDRETLSNYVHSLIESLLQAGVIE